MFTVPADWKPAAPPRRPPPGQEKPLTAEEKKTLLRIARDTLEAFVRTGRAPEIAADKYALTPALKAECGAFVTLNKKNDGAPRLHREHRLRRAAAAARR